MWSLHIARDAYQLEFFLFFGVNGGGRRDWESGGFVRVVAAYADYFAAVGCYVAG